MDLVAVDEQPSLGGRSLATLIKRNRTLALPWNRFKSGSPVVAIFKDEEGLAPCFGVVATKDNHAIQVVFDNPLEAVQLNLEMSVDDVSRNRQWSAMQAVEQSRGRIAQLRDVLLCERDPKWDTSPKLSLDMDANLNDSQRSAVAFAMSAQDLAIIHGPPGTGKTTTLIEIICQAVAKGQRVLATAPSNTAVDNLVEKLAERRIDVLRIGHPARVQESLLSHTLDAMADSDPAMEIVRQLRRDAAKCSRKRRNALAVDLSPVLVKICGGKPSSFAKMPNIWRSKSLRVFWIAPKCFVPRRPMILKSLEIDALNWALWMKLAKVRNLVAGPLYCELNDSSWPEIIANSLPRC